jgi:hypothetical protein
MIWLTKVTSPKTVWDPEDEFVRSCRISSLVNTVELEIEGWHFFTRSLVAREEETWHDYSLRHMRKHWKVRTLGKVSWVRFPARALPLAPKPSEVEQRRQDLSFCFEEEISETKASALSSSPDKDGFCSRERNRDKGTTPRQNSHRRLYQQNTQQEARYQNAVNIST